MPLSINQITKHPSNSSHVQKYYLTLNNQPDTPDTAGEAKMRP